jgi:Bacterial regulatory proteins, luxR family
MSGYGRRDVVVNMQPETAVFLNRHGQIIVRQTDVRDPHFPGDDTDMWIIISREHVRAIVNALLEIEPHAGLFIDEDEDQPEAEPEPEPSAPPLIAPPLSQRERVIAALSAGGKSNRQIAIECGCSEATVRRIAASNASPSAPEVRQTCDSGATPVRHDAPATHPQLERAST